MKDTWSDEELIGYIETHSKTELGLTHNDHMRRFYELVGGYGEGVLDAAYPKGSNKFYPIAYEDIKESIAEARENIRKKGQKMEEPTIHVVDAKPKRMSWDSYFMKISETVAMRSTCDRKHVGSLIVRDRQILSTGYNGSPRGFLTATTSDTGWSTWEVVSRACERSTLRRTRSYRRRGTVSGLRVRRCTPPPTRAPTVVGR